MNSKIQRFFSDELTLFKYKKFKDTQKIFSAIWRQFCKKHNPNWKDLSINMCDNDGKWDIIDRLQKEYKDNKKDTFWYNMTPIVDSGSIFSKNHLFEIKYKGKQVGFLVICARNLTHTLEIITVYEGFRKRGFAEGALRAVKQYYRLVDRVKQDPQTFTCLNVDVLAQSSVAFWKEMKKKLKWLKFSEDALSKIQSL